MPFLVYRSLRWHALRGGWLPEATFARPRRSTAGRSPPGTPIDVMVLVSDHFEPARRHGDAAAVASVRSWCAGYEALAGQHRDADGRPPQHTWFYRYDYPNAGCVQALGESAFRGFGEVEFHLHHGHDTHETMAATLDAGLDWFNRFGAMLTAEAEPQRQFGYVAGNWALDNGAGDDALSGCDTEILALAEAGCYADFTFPGLGSPAQPRTTNRLYYAAEDGRPKSYDTGVGLAVGRPPSGDLMIFQGPTAIDWRRGRIDDGGVENSSPPHPRRLGAWLKANVHVPGRPEWVFVKLHTHAKQNRASFLSPLCDATFTAMGQWWKRAALPPALRHGARGVQHRESGRGRLLGQPRRLPRLRAPAAGQPAAALLGPLAAAELVARARPRRPAGAGTGPALTFACGGLRSVAGRLREVEVRYRGDEVVSLATGGRRSLRGASPAAADLPETEPARPACRRPSGPKHGARPGPAASVGTGRSG